MITTQWNGVEEALPFNRTYSTVGVTTDNGANVSWGATGAAVGSNPYMRSTSAISTVGTFMVGDYYYGGLSIDLKVVLAAAWNATNNNMDKTLNTAGLIPLNDPYGLGTTVSSIPTNAVDWVKVELRNSSTPATVTNTYAKFVNQDGQIIEENGSNMKVTGAATGNYYIAVLHRNHLGVITATAVSVTESLAVNFKGAQATAWQDGSISTNTAMTEVESGTFGLWNGDANNNGTISYNSTNNDRISVLNALSAVSGAVLSFVYNVNDVNMDGNVSYNAADNDRISILNSLSAVPGVTYNQHIPE